MRIVMTTPGRFHSFDLAAELDRRGHLEKIFTGYPRMKLRAESVPAEKVASIWGLHAPLMASLRLPGQGLLAPLQRDLFEVANARLDRVVSRRLPQADGFIGLSGSGLRTGQSVQSAGGFYVCDRGSTHICFQDQIMREEAAIVGVEARSAHPATIARELAEYEVADVIFTPSTFTYQTFRAQGVPEEKLRLLPYGVNTRAFRPGGPKADRFTVLFAGQTSYRKGLHYLLRAWAQWAPANAELRIAGGRSAEFEKLVAWAGGMPRNVTLLGHLDRPSLAREMAAAHVLALTSIEEGLALVMAQALACGTPVVATENTGAETLFKHGREGLIGPARSVQFIVDSFERLAGDRDLLAEMSRNAISRAEAFASTEAYGERACAILSELHERRRPATSARRAGRAK